MNNQVQSFENIIIRKLIEYFHEYKMEAEL